MMVMTTKLGNTTPRAAAAHIKNGMTVGFSGFTVIGYPKVLPAELARRAEEGEELGITVITGGNVGDQLDGVLARSGVMKRRYGFQATGISAPWPTPTGFNMWTPM